MKSVLAVIAIILAYGMAARPARAVTNSRAAAVYSVEARGLWIVWHGTISGCETGANIASTGSSAYRISITKGPGPVCPTVVHTISVSDFFPMPSKPPFVRIGIGNRFPPQFRYSVGVSDTYKK